MLSLLRGFVHGRRDVDLETIDDAVFARALALGLGAMLAHAAASSSGRRGADVQGADLAARVLSGAWIDCVEEVVRRCAAAGCRPVLLKGAAVALRYYPEPHQRTMGDVDLLVTPDRMPALERVLREMGFARPDRGGHFAGHHHGDPFFHEGYGVWLEAHDGLFPPTSPASRYPRMSLDNLRGHLTAQAVGAASVDVMDRELQLVYTAARWAEMINLERGIFPLLDAGLVAGGPIDWDVVLSLADGDWIASALHLLLSFLDRHGLAPVPPAVLTELARRDRFANGLTRRTLHAMVLRQVVVGGSLPSRVARTVWATLATDMRPALKFPAVALNLALRPASDRPVRLRGS
jgi:hypothetical protein